MLVIPIIPEVLLIMLVIPIIPIILVGNTNTSATNANIITTTFNTDVTNH